MEIALAGDVTAMCLCLERLLPVGRDRPVMFALPKLESAGDAVAATAAPVSAVASGDLTPGEAGELSKLVEGFSRAVELHDIQQRLDRLEAVQEGRHRLPDLRAKHSNDSETRTQAKMTHLGR